MGIYGFAILIILALLASLYAGVVLGISDTKRSYGIPKGVTPELWAYAQEQKEHKTVVMTSEEWGAMHGCDSP